MSLSLSLPLFSAFLNDNERVVKPPLDIKVLEDIIPFVAKRCGQTQSQVRKNITSKLSDEDKMLRLAAAKAKLEKEAKAQAEAEAKALAEGRPVESGVAAMETSETWSMCGVTFKLGIPKEN